MTVSGVLTNIVLWSVQCIFTWFWFLIVIYHAESDVSFFFSSYNLPTFNCYEDDQIAENISVQGLCGLVHMYGFLLFSLCQMQLKSANLQ